MKYQYMAAWTVVGGIALPDKRPELELITTRYSRFLLTKNADSYLEIADKNIALRRLMLKRMIGQGNAAELPEALASEIKEIKAEREKIVGSYPVLIYETEGEIEVEMSKIHTVENKDYSIALGLDLIDKPKLRETYQAHIDAMKMAIAFQSDTPSRFTEIAQEVSLIGEDGRPIHSISISAEATITKANELTDKILKDIKTRYQAITTIENLSSVQRLFSQMAEQSRDKLRGFLFGWLSLEILISKAFKTYHQRVHFETNKPPLHPALQEHFDRRERERRNGPRRDYGLVDRFIVVSSILFPRAPKEEANQDYDRFCTFRNRREDIAHGNAYIEKDLPVELLAELLRKYGAAYIASFDAQT